MHVCWHGKAAMSAAPDASDANAGEAQAQDVRRLRWILRVSFLFFCRIWIQPFSFSALVHVFYLKQRVRGISFYWYHMSLKHLKAPNLRRGGETRQRSCSHPPPLVLRQYFMDMGPARCIFSASFSISRGRRPRVWTIDMKKIYTYRLLSSW